MAISTNRTDITLPVDVAREIIQKTQEGSAVMKLARKIALPGRGASIPMITSDPTPAWVGETDAKSVSNPGLSTKVMRGYTLAVIVPFSNQFRRDASALYEALIERLPAVLGEKFDATVFGAVNVPGSDFDSLGSCTAVSLASDVYGGLVEADTNISLNGGIVNGYAISPQARGILLGATDTTGRPLFVNNASEGAIPMILGAKTKVSKGAFVSGSPATIGYVGDWTQAMYGIVEGVDLSYSSDASLTIDGETVNLFERNMFAVRAEIEIGFRANTDMFNALTATDVPSI